MFYGITKIYNFTIEALVFFIIIFSPLVYGSVQALPLVILESTVFLILFIWWLKIISLKEPPSFIKSSFWLPILLFILLVFLQLVPLPKSILIFLSPSRVYLIDKFVPAEFISKIVFSLSIYRNQTIIKFLELLSYVSLFFILINNLESKKKFTRLIVVIISMGLLVAIIEIARQFKFPFVNKNHFAGYMELIIPLAIGYLLTDPIRPKKIILGFMTIVMFTALFLSLSRAGTLCFIGSLIFMGCAFRLRKTLRHKIKVIYILVIICFLFLMIMGIEPVLARFATLYKKEIFDTEGRWILWKDTLRIIADFPLFGTGLGTFRNIYPMYKTLMVQATVSYSHSDFLQLVSETGIIGLGLVVWFLVLFFKDIFLNWMNRHHPFVKGIVLGGITSIIAILLHSFFDFNLQIPSNAFLFTIIMALTYKCIFIKFSENEII
ncbi:MAG: O-antigen ligase family protein [Candidatus Omnitrophica bacterium]|nr:O-antigen ligase family protein [Candidatus Omnitrophota bacterium]